MAFEATKKEWCELYSFFRLLADGKVVLGTAEAKAGDTFWPVAMIQREEHDGTRQYYIEEDTIRIEGENGSKSMPREDFGIVAVATILIQFFSTISSLGIGPAIVQHKNLTKQDISNIFSFTVLIGLFIFIIFFIL